MVFKLVSPIEVKRWDCENDKDVILEDNSEELRNAILGLLNRDRFSFYESDAVQFMPNAKELQKGLMYWYSSEDTDDTFCDVNGIKGDILERCITFAYPTVEIINGKIMGVCYCNFESNNRMAREKELFSEKYHQILLDKLLNFVEGQYSDGWGEGLEQKPFEYCSDEIYVSFWQKDMNIRVEGFEIFEKRGYTDRDVSEFVDILSGSICENNSKNKADFLKTLTSNNLSATNCQKLINQISMRQCDDEHYVISHCSKCENAECYRNSIAIWECKRGFETPIFQ